MADPDPPIADGNMRIGPALLHAHRNTGIAVLYQDRKLKTVWSHNIRPPWSDALDACAGQGKVLPQQQADRLIAARKNVIATGNPAGLEFSIVDEVDGMRWFDVWIDADRNANGEFQGIITTIIETTEQKHREQTLKALLREVSHRSKNLLAIIQSIASQTGRYSGSIDGFLVRFRGRLQSLAASQDLITSSNWRGAAFRELVLGQIGRYSVDAARTVRLSGADPYLNPNAALHVGLAIHELAVNSVSYGALSRPDGFVEVSTDIDRTPEGQEEMTLLWSEAIAPGSDKALRQKRFGSVALERVVPTSLNGSAELEIGKDRLQYRLVMPKANFEID